MRLGVRKRGLAGILLASVPDHTPFCQPIHPMPASSPSITFCTPADVDRWLDSRGLLHMELGLGRIRRVLDGLPTASGMALHIVGTNGKGSTAACVDGIARAHGLRTGRYTSPHIASVRERITIDGAQLSDEAWVRCANAVAADMQPGEGALTYFEFLTAMAYAAFAESDVDLAIYEAGLGGTHDATTAIGRDLLAITAISLDHMAVLGNTVEQIAADKAGAMDGVTRALTVEQPPAIGQVLADCARGFGTELQMTAPTQAPPARLPGEHQRHNAGLAVAAFEALAPGLGVVVNPQRVCTGLEAAFLPGRVHVRPPYILDAAHNVASMLALVQALDEMALRPTACIFGCLGDKDPAALLGILGTIDSLKLLVAVPLDNERGLDADRMRELLAECAVGQTAVAPDVAAAQMQTKGHTTLVCGSHYLLEAFYGAGEGDGSA